LYGLTYLIILNFKNKINKNKPDLQVGSKYLALHVHLYSGLFLLFGSQISPESHGLFQQELS
jgi:hypothetical protein